MSNIVILSKNVVKILPVADKSTVRPRQIEFLYYFLFKSLAMIIRIKFYLEIFKFSLSAHFFKFYMQWAFSLEISKVYLHFRVNNEFSKFPIQKENFGTKNEYFRFICRTASTTNEPAQVMCLAIF